MEGLKSVKCYGSAMSLKSQLAIIPGIVGLDAYASSHTVEIYYDPAIMTAEKVKESIFTPAKQEVNKVDDDLKDSISVCEVAVNGLFDNIDYNNFAWALKKGEGVYGYETHFGEPVRAVIYFNENLISLIQIERLIKAKTIKVRVPKGFDIREINFKVEDAKMLPGKIDVKEYRKRMFKSYNKMFNKYKTYKPEQLKVFVFPMPEAGTANAARKLSFLMSHLSNNEGIVRLATVYTDAVYAYVYFDPEKTTVEKVKEDLMSKKITVTYVSGEKETVDNPFELNPTGVVKTAVEVNLPDIIR
jgi:hypothetical protein